MSIRTYLVFFIVTITALLLSTGCSGNGGGMEANPRLALSFTGLPELGSGYVYEGWLIIGGAPFSTGRFGVDAQGVPSASNFDVSGIAGAMDAAKFVLTIEPAVGDDPAPANTHILAGDITAGTANLSVGDGAALGTNFLSAAGQFILNTPSTASTDADFSQGIWWLDPMAGPGATLTLPQLPAGWQYEGWAVVDGTPLSTGKFTMPNAADDDGAGPTAGPDNFPAFPGQDFINPAVDLHGGAAVISVEPMPDNDAAPFALKPLVGDIPMGLAIGTLSGMDNNAAATNPTGAAVLSMAN